MSNLAETSQVFFEKTGLDRTRIEGIVGDALHGADDGELYLEYRKSEALSWDDGKLKSASYDTTQGFGLRAVAGEVSGYAHAAELSEDAIKRAASIVRAIASGHNGTQALAARGTNSRLYMPESPLEQHALETKLKVMADIDAYARGRDSRVRQVMISLTGSWQAVEIIRPGEAPIADIRPLVRLQVSVMLGEGDRQETGSHGAGGRVSYDEYLQPENWQASVDEAIRKAAVNLGSVAAPAGEMVVVVGAGWPGVLLHEAIGHGLEGDFNRKETSAFTGMIGQRVATKGITIVDDGTLQDRRGSLTVDDEGTPTQCTTLIEDGILVGYMQDRLNARLMGQQGTGNGRRESFAHVPLPRMTNTYMRNGTMAPEEIIASVKHGLYAPDFGGGQVDIVSGKYVFSATEAYLIEDGKIGPAVKGATLIGNGPIDLTKISMIGNDMALDTGIGTCGKAGQSLPVGLGQPTLRLDGITVGGTAVG
jgi:TldD protein